MAAPWISLWLLCADQLKELLKSKKRRDRLEWITKYYFFFPFSPALVGLMEVALFLKHLTQNLKLLIFGTVPDIVPIDEAAFLRVAGLLELMCEVTFLFFFLLIP